MMDSQREERNRYEFHVFHVAEDSKRRKPSEKMHKLVGIASATASPNPVEEEWILALWLRRACGLSDIVELTLLFDYDP